MTKRELDTLCSAIRLMKRRSAKFESIRSKIEKLRDDAKLQTTKAIYQAILDMFDEEE